MSSLSNYSLPSDTFSLHLIFGMAETEADQVAAYANSMINHNPSDKLKKLVQIDMVV